MVWLLICAVIALPVLIYGLIWAWRKGNDHKKLDLDDLYLVMVVPTLITWIISVVALCAKILEIGGFI